MASSKLPRPTTCKDVEQLIKRLTVRQLRALANRLAVRAFIKPGFTRYLELTAKDAKSVRECLELHLNELLCSQDVPELPTGLLDSIDAMDAFAVLLVDTLFRTPGTVPHYLLSIHKSMQEEHNQEINCLHLELAKRDRGQDDPNLAAKIVVLRFIKRMSFGEIGRRPEIKRSRDSVRGIYDRCRKGMCSFPIVKEHMEALCNALTSECGDSLSMFEVGICLASSSKFFPEREINEVKDFSNASNKTDAPD